MEERFDRMRCPNCGQEMHKGFTGVGYREDLDWYPGRSFPGSCDLLKILYSKAGGNAAIGRRFTSRFRTKPSFFPAWYCDSCELMMVDTKTEMERA